MNGQQELAEVVTGLRKSTDGTVKVGGVDLTNKTADKFIANGVGHIPGDRIGVGLAGNLPVSDNLIMKAFRSDVVSKGIFLRHDAIRDYSNKLIEDFDVDTPDRNTPVRNLSGGNQQKAILAREIMARAEQGPGDNGLLVAVQPTRGLDVGATEGVRRALLEQREKGTAIVLISEDLDELLSLSDRSAVMHAGKIMGLVRAVDANMEEIGLMMAGEALEHTL